IRPRVANRVSMLRPKIVPANRAPMAVTRSKQAALLTATACMWICSRETNIRQHYCAEHHPISPAVALNADAKIPTAAGPLQQVFASTDRLTALLYRCAGEFDDFGPLVGFISHDLAELRGRPRQWRATQFGEPRLQRWILERVIDRLVQFLNHLGWRTLRRTHAEPGACLVAGNRFGNGRHVWESIGTRLRRDRKRAQSAGANVLDGCRQIVEHDLHLTAYQIGQCWS